jgi:hypothetical protein
VRVDKMKNGDTSKRKWLPSLLRRGVVIIAFDIYTGIMRKICSYIFMYRIIQSPGLPPEVVVLASPIYIFFVVAPNTQ